MVSIFMMFVSFSTARLVSRLINPLELSTRDYPLYHGYFFVPGFTD